MICSIRLPSLQKGYVLCALHSFGSLLIGTRQRTIYYGSRENAKGYFESLGFECPEGANVADFLTSVTVPTERRIRPGFETFPRTIEDFVEAYQRSETCRAMLEEVQNPATMTDYAELFKQCVLSEKASSWRGTPSPYTVTLCEQVAACTKRYDL